MPKSDLPKVASKYITKNGGTERISSITMWTSQDIQYVADISQFISGDILLQLSPTYPTNKTLASFDKRLKYLKNVFNRF